MNEYDLERFLKMHQMYYDTALAEIRQGRKRSHWIWFTLFSSVSGAPNVFNNVLQKCYGSGADGRTPAMPGIKNDDGASR